MENGKYDDIIFHPRHISKSHKPMKREDRAAQFAPFSAVVGHDVMAREEARLTEEMPQIDEDKKMILNDKLCLLREIPQAYAQITYFLPDSKKKGGSYITKKCRVKKIDEYSRMVITDDGDVIPIESITEITEDNLI